MQSHKVDISLKERVSQDVIHFGIQVVTKELIYLLDLGGDKGSTNLFNTNVTSQPNIGNSKESKSQAREQVILLHT